MYSKINKEIGNKITLHLLLKYSKRSIIQKLIIPFRFRQIHLSSSCSQSVINFNDKLRLANLILLLVEILKVFNINRTASNISIFIIRYCFLKNQIFIFNSYRTLSCIVRYLKSAMNETFWEWTLAMFRLNINQERKL